MNTPRICPRCGAALPVDAPKGLCPRCLAAMNLAPDTHLTGADSVAAQSPLTPAELAPHFPQLEILEYLGRGGMGVVYKARQKSLNRLIALKLLAPERANDPPFAQRFSREAQALAALNHPHIVGVYDFGQAGGFFFLLMEFVDGVNLRQAMKAGRFTPEQALAVVPPVCEALQYAHEHGIVHRDIKPENLLLDQGGRVKIADFGIAKMLHADGSDIGLADSQPAGTPQYMAPEQKEHRRTDHRADIYSLGVVLYELLTGELPADKLQPPSRKVQIDVRLDEIVLRALEVKPERRYQTAGDMRTQVETVVSTPRSGRGETPLSSSPWRLIKAGFSTLATPEQLATAKGQFFHYRTRGQLILDDRQLTHTREGTNTVIPLAAIRDLSMGKLPRALNPAGLNVLSVTYKEGEQSKRLLFSPMVARIAFPWTYNAHVAEWYVMIREAVTVATGSAPPCTPAHQVDLPRSSPAILFMHGSFLVVGLFLIRMLLTRPAGPPLSTVSVPANVEVREYSLLTLFALVAGVLLGFFVLRKLWRAVIGPSAARSGWLGALLTIALLAMAGFGLAVAWYWTARVGKAPPAPLAAEQAFPRVPTGTPPPQNSPKGSAEPLALFAPVDDPSLGPVSYRLVCTLVKPRHVALAEIAFVDDRSSTAHTISQLGFSFASADGPSNQSCRVTWSIEDVREGLGAWIVRIQGENRLQQFDRIVRLAGGDKGFPEVPLSPEHPDHGPHLSLDPSTTTWATVRPERSYWVGPGEWSAAEWNSLTLFEARNREGKVLGHIRLSLLVCPMLTSASAPWTQTRLRNGDWKADPALRSLIGDAFGKPLTRP